MRDDDQRGSMSATSANRIDHEGDDHRLGPAQPKRARWQDTVRAGSPIDDRPPEESSAPHDASHTDESPEAPSDDVSGRRLGPSPIRRPGATREFRAAPPPGIPDDDDRSLSSLARPPLIAGAVMTVVAVLALLITLVAVTQAVTLYNEIATLPNWLRPIAYGVLAIVSLALLYFGARVVWLYVKLRVSPRLSLAADDLERRDRVRDELREQRLADARETLTGYLHEYAFDQSQKAALGRLGVETGILDELESIRHVLLSRHAVSDHAAWLQRFQAEFLDPLDRVASRHTRRLMKQVFVASTMAPRGSLDTLIVLAVCYRLIADLCVIYRVRAGRWETALILGHVLVSVFTASQMDEIGEEIGSTAGDLLDTSIDALPGILSSVVGQVLGKGSEGGVNVLLLWRLSVRAQRYLRPIRKRPEPSVQPA
jgi:putative membrane protein